MARLLGKLKEKLWLLEARDKNKPEYVVAINRSGGKGLRVFEDPF